MINCTRETSPAKFTGLIRQSRFTLSINFNSAHAVLSVRYEHAAKSRVSLIAAPVYDQDTTQVAEYDGGMYITPAFTTT